MDNFIKLKGLIHFDPIDMTKKHKNQANWKRMSMVLIEGDLCEYYSWFIKKRYSIDLNKTLRGAHISFINDSINDIKKGLKCTDLEAEFIWNNVKNKWDNKEIDIILNPDVRGNYKHYWLNIPEEYRTELHNIRKELGLDRPFFGLHMSIGTIKTSFVQQEHAIYIQKLINEGLINT